MDKPGSSPWPAVESRCGAVSALQPAVPTLSGLPEPLEFCTLDLQGRQRSTRLAAEHHLLKDTDNESLQELATHEVKGSRGSGGEFLGVNTSSKMPKLLILNGWWILNSDVSHLPANHTCLECLPKKAVISLPPSPLSLHALSEATASLFPFSSTVYSLFSTKFTQLFNKIVNIETWS